MVTKEKEKQKLESTKEEGFKQSYDESKTVNVNNLIKKKKPAQKEETENSNIETNASKSSSQEKSSISFHKDFTSQENKGIKLQYSQERPAFLNDEEDDIQVKPVSKHS